MELALIAFAIIYLDVRRRRTETLAVLHQPTGEHRIAFNCSTGEVKLYDRNGLVGTVPTKRPPKRTVPFREGKVRWMWDRLANPYPPRSPGIPMTQAWANCLQLWGMAS